ncbi:MAG: cell division protein FtsZ, partial [Promethearchaeota archaeon]
MKPVFFPTNSPQSENPLVDEQEISHLNKNQWDHSMSSFNREAQGPQYSKFSQSPQFSQFSQSSQSPQSSRSSQFGSNSRLSQAPISQDPHRSVSSLGSLGKSLKQANGRFQSAQNLRQTQENFDNGSAFNSESKSQFQSQAQAKSFYSPKQNIPPFFSKKPSQSTNGVQTPIMQQPSLNRPIYPTREPNNSNFQNPRQSIPRAIPSNATRKSPSTNARNKVSQNKIGHANIIIVGCGGAGNNTVDRMMKIGIRGAYCVAINTDQQHLNSIIAHKKVLIGRQCTRGLGAGGEPEIGQQAAEESRTEIESILKNGDLIFITCGMGGGTGTGSAPIVAEIAKNIGAIVVGVVTMPFDAEMGRKQKAKEGVAVLRNYVDTLVMIENNRLLSIAADLPINDAFNLADEVLATMVKGITETISLPSIINLDYADIRSILTAGGVAIVGIGE